MSKSINRRSLMLGTAGLTAAASIAAVADVHSDASHLDDLFRKDFSEKMSVPDAINKAMANLAKVYAETAPQVYGA